MIFEQIKNYYCFVLLTILFIFSNNIAIAQPWNDKSLLSSEDSLRGFINSEREWWDILTYDITIKPNIHSKTIMGQNKITFRTISPSTKMQIDLQSPLKIDSVLLDNGKKISFEKNKNIWYLQIPTQMINSINTVIIFYSGEPHTAQLPPWDGGWIWEKDSLNRPWISVACQGIGASIWFPCKDHQSDEPDNGIFMSIIVPDSLMAISNGRLIATEYNKDGTSKYIWRVLNPINNYGISFYIGNYQSITETYNGLNGNLDVTYWFIDYNFEKVKKHLLTEVNRALTCFENWFGAYPFYEDGYQIIDVPGYGMEHQSGIAYGNNYQKGNKGRDFSGTGWGMKWDFLVVHETAHEWFGNNITTYDLADKWVHESFAAYSEVLFLNDFFSKEAGDEYTVGMKKMVKNDTPIIGKYGINMQGSSDMYSKGRYLIHMIRQIISNDDKFKKILRGLNQKYCHSIVTSNEIENYINNQVEVNLSPIFNQYLRTIKIPVLEYFFLDTQLNYKFTNCNNDFTMPVLVYVNGNKLWLTPNTQWQKINSYSFKEAIHSIEIDKNFFIDIKKYN